MTNNLFADAILRDFPFIFWENTESGNEAFEKAKTNFIGIKNKAFSEGKELLWNEQKYSFDCDGFAQVYLPGTTYVADPSESTEIKIKKALEHCRKHGATGWWTLNALEQLLCMQGPCLVNAMHELGYKQGAKKDSWVKANGSARPEYNTQRLFPEEKHVIPKIWNRSLSAESKTWTARTGLSGMIYLLLDSDRQDNNGAHIAATQGIDERLTVKQFSIGAKQFLNILYTKGSTTTNHYWPTRITTNELLHVAKALYENCSELKYL